MENIGKISYQRGSVLGRGYGGTVVCRGQFEKRDVAVKIISKNYYKFFKRETMILQNVDSHPNVVRYFCSEEDHNFFYLALEICRCTLEEMISKPNIIMQIKPTKILYDTALGLAYLHSMTISNLFCTYLTIDCNKHFQFIEISNHKISYFALDRH